MLQSIVNCEKDKEIDHLKILLEKKIKELEDSNKKLNNLNEYISVSYNELGKIFGSLRSLTAFSRKGTDLCTGPLKNKRNKRALVKLLGQLSSHFSSNQVNLLETIRLLENENLKLKEGQDHVISVQNFKRKTCDGKICNFREKNLPLVVNLPFSCYICKAQFDQHSKLMSHMSVVQ